jgi:hypothetical protein
VSKVNEVAFFVEEINRNIYRPAERHILFRNRRGNGITEFVFIGSLIRSPEGTYALDIEGIGLNSEWGVQYHFQAEYGKFRGQHLIMRALDREDPEVRREPTYIEGSSLPGELSSVLRLSGPPEELETVSQGGAALERAGVLSLWDMTQLFPQYGFPVEPVYMELGMRLLQPFAFLSLTIFVAALAWRWRSRYIARPPLLALALLPAVPFILGYVTSLYVHAHQILIGFLLLFAGMAAAFAVLILVETLILVIALFALVGQTTGS